MFNQITGDLSPSTIIAHLKQLDENIAQSNPQKDEYATLLKAYINYAFENKFYKSALRKIIIFFKWAAAYRLKSTEIIDYRLIKALCHYHIYLASKPSPNHLWLAYCNLQNYLQNKGSIVDSEIAYVNYEKTCAEIISDYVVWRNQIREHHLEKYSYHKNTEVTITIEKQEEKTDFLDFPNECLLMIIESLTIADVVALSRVNKQLNIFCTDAFLWEAMEPSLFKEIDYLNHCEMKIEIGDYDAKSRIIDYFAKEKPLPSITKISVCGLFIVMLPLSYIILTVVTLFKVFGTKGNENSAWPVVGMVLGSGGIIFMFAAMVCAKICMDCLQERCDSINDIAIPSPLAIIDYIRTCQVKEENQRHERFRIQLHPTGETTPLLKR